MHARLVKEMLKRGGSSISVDNGYTERYLSVTIHKIQSLDSYF